MFNLLEDKGLMASEEYIQQFSEQEKKEMLDMYHLVKKEGAETIKKHIMKNMPLEEDHYLHNHVYEETDSITNGRLLEDHKREAVMNDDS